MTDRGKGESGGDCPFATEDWYCCKTAGHEGLHESVPLGGGPDASPTDGAITVKPSVFRMGWEAALAGKGRGTCPFVVPANALAWNMGYDDALRERQK